MAAQSEEHVKEILWQRTHLNDRLAKEIIRLSCKFLSKFGLEVVIFIPYPNFDTV